MAANFWNSSHYRQLLDPEEVDVVHDLDKERGISVEDFRLIKFHISNHIMKLAQHIKVRQRVVATAITYMRRVYIRKSMVECEPRLVGLTCLYLASKAEESIVQAKALVFYANRLYSGEYKYEVKDILGMEMKVLEALDYYLVVFHPYRSLSEFLQDAAINDVNMNQVTWGIINDTYKMDLILVHPPYRIALACIYIASVHREKDITAWFEDLHEDMNLVKNIAMEILEFYEKYRTITEERSCCNCSKLYDTCLHKEIDVDTDEKYRYEIKDILEMDMKILEALNFYLVVFHPYRSLAELLQDSGINDKSITHLTWGLVSDTYRMDLILTHPPYLIALACIYIASVYKEKDIRTWFEELGVDMNIVKNIAMEILDFYENHRTFTEERVHAAFNKLAINP